MTAPLTNEEVKRLLDACEAMNQRFPHMAGVTIVECKPMVLAALCTELLERRARGKTLRGSPFCYLVDSPSAELEAHMTIEDLKNRIALAKHCYGGSNHASRRAFRAANDPQTVIADCEELIAAKERIAELESEIARTRCQACNSDALYIDSSAPK